MWCSVSVCNILRCRGSPVLSFTYTSLKDTTVFPALVLLCQKNDHLWREESSEMCVNVQPLLFLGAHEQDTEHQRAAVAELILEAHGVAERQNKTTNSTRNHLFFFCICGQLMSCGLGHVLRLVWMCRSDLREVFSFFCNSGNPLPQFSEWHDLGWRMGVWHLYAMLYWQCKAYLSWKSNKIMGEENKERTDSLRQTDQTTHL